MYLQGWSGGTEAVLAAVGGVRIRQVRPEFWTDATMAALSPAVRLFYIGLWNVSDDAGWFTWSPSQIGAVLFPYEPTKRRQRDIVAWSEKLIERGRLIVHDCGCAQIPTLARHQRVTGKQSFTGRDAHVKHLSLTGKQSSLSGSPVTLGNVTEGNGMLPARASDDPLALRDEEDRLEMAVLRPRIVS